MDTSKTLKSLIKQLYTPLLFFIPKSIIPLSELSEFRNIKTEEFFNTIVLLSENNSTEKVLAITDCIPLLEKASILNYNTIRKIRGTVSISFFFNPLENRLIYQTVIPRSKGFMLLLLFYFKFSVIDFFVLP